MLICICLSTLFEPKCVFHHQSHIEKPKPFLKSKLVLKNPEFAKNFKISAVKNDQEDKFGGV